jgi:hypothetical protein
LQNKSSNVNFDWLHLPFQSRGVAVKFANNVAVIDNMMQEFSKIIFPEGKLGSNVRLQENPDFYELIFNLEGKSTVEISFFVGLCQFNPDFASTQADYWNSLVENNSKSYFYKISDLPLNYFDYQAAIRDWNISYIVVRDFESIPRFAEDPSFSLVYKNNQVAIFKTNNP